MTINKTAYETTACNGFRMNKTMEEVTKSYHNGEFSTIEGYDLLIIEGIGSTSSAVTAFAHPLLVDNKVAVDVRPFGSFDRVQNTFKIRNMIDYEIMTDRGCFNDIWVNKGFTHIRDISTLPLHLYTSWISEAVSRRYGLDPREQYLISIVAGIFFCSQFTDEADFDEQEKMRIVNLLTRVMKVSSQDILTIIEKTSVIKSVFEFCSRCADITESVRLKDFNTGILFTILGGTWFGVNAKEMIAVAIEHPPTWLAIVKAAVGEKTFKNSAISKMLERNMFRRETETFTPAIKNLLEVMKKVGR